jgi:ABC-type uncharacterized transport system permease subunit
MSVAPSRAPSLLDVAAAASLTLSSVAIVGLPPVSTEFGISTSASAVAVTLALFGTIGLVVCWIVGSLHSTRVLLGVLLFAAGIALWVVTMFVAEPVLGWRMAASTVGLASELLVTAGWFVLRGYPAKVFPALLFLVAGAVLVYLSPSLAVLVAGLVGGPVATFTVALLVLRAGRPRRQPSATSAAL